MLTEIIRFRAIAELPRSEDFDPKFRYGRDNLEEVRAILSARQSDA